MTIGTPEPHRGAYLLLEIVLCLLFGPPIIYALIWVVGETVEHFTP